MPRERHWYTDLALISFNTFLLLLALNLILWAAAPLFRQPTHFDPIVAFGLPRVLQSYPGWKEADVIALVHETDQLDTAIYQYEPYTQFKLRPLHGRYLNINPAGFRVIRNQAPWPPDPSAFNIFVFGGSTTFGVGVADEETIPSYLQEETAADTPHVAVYNFGRLGYFSTQELLLFYRMLSAGAAPKLAIFIDGINDFHSFSGEPDLTSELASLLDSEHQPWRLLRALPMWRAVSRAVPRPAPDFSDAGSPNGIIRRLRTNEALIRTLCDAHHVKPVFVLQPLPVYQYDLRYHYLNGADWSRYLRYADGAKYGYPLLAAMRGEFESKGDFLWLAGIQEGRHQNFYVSDGLHYSAPFSREIARAIRDFLKKGTA
ncbi:MAG TPA: SGNH/GDSL hydrolase family protein [Bryobacteraceae bacterium]|nr:SGNH/GDSL hydrolase family protein [Bryobacteraceae bacterium]